MERVYRTSVIIYLLCIVIIAGLGYVGYQLYTVNGKLDEISRDASRASGYAESSAAAAKEACENTRSGSAFGCN